MAKVMFSIREQHNDSVYYGCWNIFATRGSSGFVQVSR